MKKSHLDQLHKGRSYDAVLVVTCRDKAGRNNALVVGFTANVSLNPPMVMVGIVPTRFSPDNCVVGGVPAKVIKEIENDIE